MSGWLRIGIVLLTIWEIGFISSYLAATFWPETFEMSRPFAEELVRTSGPIALASPVLFVIAVATFRWVMRGFEG